VTVIAYLAFGSNLGDRHGYLERARRHLEAVPGVEVLAVTPMEDTAPLGGFEQPPYLNCMARVRTSLDAPALLARCHDIERREGRRRRERWASRTLDLDLVRYDNVLCDLPGLTLPHVGLRDRDFWMREIAFLEDHA
jgi:2-amino-4-hydroxy-6-hydroxymethyldihydropteridine diphosphokinase